MFEETWYDDKNVDSENDENLQYMAGIRSRFLYSRLS